MEPLPPEFYARPTLTVARDLLGRTLWICERERVCGGQLVEVEAYIGEDDPACHAHPGPTARNRVMYGPPGRAYVYFTYGNHWMLNFVTEPEGFPAAVLIRAIEPTDGLAAIQRRRPAVATQRDLTNGPGKLTAALGITGADNDAPLQGPRLIVGGNPPARRAVVAGERIGIRHGRERLWRFYLDGNPWVSRPAHGARERPTPVGAKQ